MKKLLKIFIFFIVSIIGLIIILTVVAKLAENKITDIAMEKISDSVEVPIIIDNVSFNLLRKFPLATIELEDVWMGSSGVINVSDSLSTDSDTIINIGKIYVSVKSKPLLSGSIEIMKVDIDGANINYNVNSSGVSNIDFLISTDTIETDTLPSDPIKLTLTNLSVKNIICNFNDSSLKTKAKVVIPELKVKAKIDSANILASVKGGISLTNCSFGETNLYLMNKTDINFDVDYENDSVSIKQLVVNTDGAELNLLGSVLLGDEIKTDVKLKGSDLILGELIKYAPKEMLNEFGLEKVSGKINLDATVKGTVSESELPRVDLSIDLRNGSVVTTDYPRLKNISFKGEITNGILRNNKSTQANFSSFHFETDSSKFDMAFSVLDIDHPKYDIKTNMEINISEFSDFIPDTLVQYINGNIKASLSTKGELPDSIGDDFVDYIMANSRANIELADFNIDLDSTLSINDFSSELTYKPNNIQINDLNISVPAYKVRLKNTSFDADFRGSINKTAEMHVDLKSYHIETNRSKFKGNAQIDNFDNPTYNFTSNIKLNLDEVKTMLPDTLLNELTGSISALIKSSGTLNLDSVADQAMDIVFESSSFKVNFEDVTVELPDDPLYKIENFTGLVNMKPNVITINKMKGIAGGIEFGIDSTKIENIYNSVIKNLPEQLTVNTRISFGDLDYAMFAPFIETDSSQAGSEALESNEEIENAGPTNFTMLIKGAASVKSFTYEKAYLEDISTLFKVTDSVYIADQFKFKAFEGNMNTSVKYTIKPNNKSIIDMRNIIDRMDIQKLLSDFDNFEDYYEPSITSENLSGLFSTDLYSRFVMLGDSMVQKNMRIKGDIKLENGGVFDFEPAMELSKFTGINELDNIQFKTLESKIFIFKNSIFVPETYISSTAVDITAYGMQSFGEDYEYHLKIHLGDILLGKSKKLMKEQSKMGDIAGEDERRALYVVSYSLDGKNKNGFDNKTLQTKMLTKIRVQDKMLNLIFHPRLVNFDTGIYIKKQ